MRAIDEIGSRIRRPEVQGGDQKYLTDVVSKRMDAIFAM